MRPLAIGPFVAVLLAAAAAAGQAPPGKNDPALQAIAKQFEEGKRLFREGKRLHDAAMLERAYFDFKAAYAVYQGKGALLNLVDSELATNRSLDAMKHLREFLRVNGPPDGHSEYGRVFQEEWSAAFAATAHIVVEADPSLRLLVDGKDDAGITPLADPIDVAPGHHVVESSGAEKLRAETDVLVGGTEHVKLFAPARPSPPTPAAASTSAPEVTPPPVPEQPVTPDHPPYWTGRHLWGLGLVGGGVLSIGLGAFFAVQAHGDASTAASILSGLSPTACASGQSAQCQQLQSVHDDQSRDHTLNLVFMTAGVVAVATGAALILWPQTSPSKTAIVPVLAPQGAGLQLRGEL